MHVTSSYDLALDFDTVVHYSVNERGDLVPIRNLRHNPLTPDPAEVPADAGDSILQTLFAGKPQPKIDPVRVREVIETFERMMLEGKAAAVKVTVQI